MASLYKRNGVWYIKWHDGARWHYRSLRTRNERQALAEKRALEAALTTKARAKRGPHDLTWADLRTRILEWAPGHWRPRNIDSRERSLRYFAEFCPVARIRDTTTEHIEEFKRARLSGKDGRDGIGARAVNESLTALQACVQRAIRQGWYVGRNPFVGIERMPEQRKQYRWLDRAQIDALLTAARVHGRDMECFVALCVFAGLRKGEALAARWEWVDWQSNLLHVAQEHGWQSKTGEDRTLPLKSELRAILKAYRANFGWVVAPDCEPGVYEYRTDIRKAFAAVVKAAELDWVTPHVLRHTFASQLVSAGVSIFKVSRWMGHASVRTTEQRYAHLAPQDGEIDKF